MSQLTHDWFPRPLPANVALGERSWLYSSFALIHYRSRRPIGLKVGHDSGLYNGTFFELGPHAEVEIGSYCTLVGAILRSDSRITIGDYSFLAHEVVLADSWAPAPPRRAGAPVEEIERDGGAKPEVSIALGRNVWVGARAVLLAGARIGEGAIVGAAAVVDFAVPAFAIVAGNPARIVGDASSRARR